MTLDIQFKIKNNANYLRYLRENSFWYNELNRNHENFKLFEQEVKERYRLRPTDRFEKAIQTFEILQNVMSSFK